MRTLYLIKANKYYNFVPDGAEPSGNDFFCASFCLVGDADTVQTLREAGYLVVSHSISSDLAIDREHSDFVTGAPDTALQPCFAFDLSPVLGIKESEVSSDNSEDEVGVSIATDLLSPPQSP